MFMLETLTINDAVQFWSYCFMFGLGMGYAWRAFFQFF